MYFVYIHLTPDACTFIVLTTKGIPIICLVINLICLSILLKTRNLFLNIIVAPKLDDFNNTMNVLSFILFQPMKNLHSLQDKLIGTSRGDEKFNKHAMNE